MYNVQCSQVHKSHHIDQYFDEALQCAISNNHDLVMAVLYSVRDVNNGSEISVCLRHSHLSTVPWQNTFSGGRHSRMWRPQGIGWGRSVELEARWARHETGLQVGSVPLLWIGGYPLHGYGRGHRLGYTSVRAR